MSGIAEFFRFDEQAERDSADNPLGALGPQQRRAGGPWLALAFGWGFLITGLLTTGALGAGVPLWPDLLWYSLLGNLVNFGIGALAHVWTQSPGTARFYTVAVFAGLLCTVTTLFGVKGLEKGGCPR